MFPFLPQLVELKNGETYNGHLVSCDNWMNINLREVICTSRVSHLVEQGPLDRARFVFQTNMYYMFLGKSNGLCA